MTTTIDGSVTIADNASTDATWVTAQWLGTEIPHVRAVRLDEKGRGALRTVWQQSQAAVVAWRTWTSTRPPTSRRCSRSSRRS